MNSTTSHVPALTAEETRYWRWVGAFEGMWQDIAQVIDSHVGRAGRRACDDLLATIDALKVERASLRRRTMTAMCDGDEDTCTRGEGVLLCDWHTVYRNMQAVEADRDQAERQCLAVCQALGMAHEPEGQAPSPCSVEEAISAVREMRSDAGRYHESEGAMMDLTMLRPLDEYHEDAGAVLWWTVPIVEPPHVGWGPGLEEDFPDHLTHWSPLPTVKEPGQ